MIAKSQYYVSRQFHSNYFGSILLPVGLDVSLLGSLDNDFLISK
jgi:hypothetical protein